MDAADRARLMADLLVSHCELNHGPDAEAPQAVDFMVIPMGTTDGPVEEIKRELVVAVCQECADALQGEEWTLLYCFECSASHWVNRSMAKNKYRHHVLWLRGCPDCTGKFGGLYFAEDSRSEMARGEALLTV